MHTIYRKLRDRYAAAAAGCLVFAFIHELFSHGVYSPFMIFAFLLPLLFGAVPCAVLSHAPARSLPGTASRQMYRFGLASLTAGCLFRGILEIYGTTSRLEPVYWAAGALLLVSAAGAYLTERWERSSG